ncbi:hypothetical protein DL93DRAFT_2091444 [Clavulina sp. PMI_390]|nr:hypothetical protein DL93DRAFT_2091444 [Clavulina sp. PMI_390]
MSEEKPQSVETPETPRAPSPQSEQPKEKETITTQPTAVSEMSAEKPKTSKLKQGVGCLVGELHVETG